MKSFARLSLPLVAIVLTALACAARPSSEPNKLKDAVRTYNEQQRWGQWQAAAKYVAPDKAHEWLLRRQRAGNIKVADIQLLQIAPDFEKKTAMSLVQVSWYRPPNMRLITVTREQYWERLDEGWRVVKEQLVKAPAPVTSEGEAWP